jgi:hypothetical protein
MKSAIFTIDIFKDLNYKGRIALAGETENQEILVTLAEDSNQYVRGQVVQNVNTPIYILVKMLDEYDGESWSLKTETSYSRYTKESIEKTLILIERELGSEFETVKRISEVLYGKKHFI